MTGRTEQQLCSFTWTDVMWKSFQDGFIKKLDMQLFQTIAQGRRREVPLRLFRILDKRFYHTRKETMPIAKFDLHRLCIHTLRLCADYSPSQMIRVLDRAAHWLIECGYLQEFWYAGKGRSIDVHFRKRTTGVKNRCQCSNMSRLGPETPAEQPRISMLEDSLKKWLSLQSEAELYRLETEALESQFGRELERTIIADERSKRIPLLSAGRTRQEYVRRYVETRVPQDKLVNAG